VRTRVAPFLIPIAVAFAPVREFMFRTVSQITLNYRGGPLSRGIAGHVQGGDRLPWAPVGESDNFATLATMDWQVHVYGSASAELVAWCAVHSVPLHIFEWRSEHEKVGLVRDALFLLRPDSYVALADGSGAPSALERYFGDHGIQQAPLSRRG
jgi:hypothetical protein